MQQIKERYENLQDSEQKIVLIFASLFLLVILIFGLLMPVGQSIETKQLAVNSMQNSVNKFKQAIPVIRANRGNANSANNSMPLNSVITGSTRQFNLLVSRVQEKSDTEVQVWLDNAEFNKVMQWINELNKRYNVSVASLSMRNKERNGLVSMDIKLTRS